MPQNNVYSVVQGPGGYLWFGTAEGLVRFDGVTFTVFDKRDVSGLGHNYVWSLLYAPDESPNGTLWIGTYGGGLFRLKDGAFLSYTTRDGLAADRIWVLTRDAGGALWIGTEGGGVSRFDKGVFRTFSTANGLPHDSVRALWPDKDGTVWVGTEGGLARIRGEVLERVAISPGAQPTVRAILRDRRGALWVGTGGAGLLREDGGRFASLVKRDGLTSESITALFQDRDGSLWVGTGGGGLLRLIVEESGRSLFPPLISSFRALDGLSNDWILTLAQDGEGSLWAGTQGGGLNRLRDGKVTAFTTREGLSHNNIWAVMEDRGGHVWVGTRGGGLNRLTFASRGAYAAPPVAKYQARNRELGNDSVYALLEDRTGTLWIGTDGGGLTRLRNGTFKTFTTKDGLSNNSVLALGEDEEGAIWVGTDGGGLTCIRGERFERFGKAQGLSSNVVWHIQRAPEGGLWIGTEGGGLNRLKDGRFTALSTRDGLAHDSVRTIHRDQDGALWIGTEGGGLSRYRDGRFTTFRSKDGLFDDLIFQILDDGLGSFWMSCNRGIFRVKKADLEAFAAGRIPSFKSTAYGTADGMKSSECNGGQAWVSKDGRLWFPTIRGVVAIDPAHIPLNEVVPNVVLERVLVDAQALDPVHDATLPPGRTKFEFHYTATSFLAPERVRFRYRLEGFDKDWVEAGTRRAAYYTNIPHGSYRFRVTACNNDEVWNASGASFVYRLKPYFYQTWIFMTLGGALAVALGFGAFRLRIAQMKRREKELQTLVDEKTNELRERTAEVEKAYSEVRKSEEELRKAQNEIEKLTESSIGLLEDTETWARSLAGEVAKAISAQEIGVYAIDDQRVEPLSKGSTRTPTYEEILRLKDAGTLVPKNGETVVPLLGMTGEPRGAFVILGPDTEWGEGQLRLITGFAHHLGTALDLRLLRTRLVNAEVRRAATLKDMHARGIDTAEICPICKRCTPHAIGAGRARCAEDRALLDSSRVLPYRVQDRYRLERLLGEGGMGIVFRAYDERLQREIALKIIRAELLNDQHMRFRLEREAHAIARIHHPGVIALHDSGELEDGSAYLVMELLKGLDLATVLSHYGPGTPKQAASLLKQAAAALSAAHQEKVIHRDVKPENIFLVAKDGGFQVKLLDFGLAKSTKWDTRLTMSGMVVGTPAYMSPEQVLGHEVDPRSDLYSLATVTFEALAGRRVFGGTEVAQVMSSVLYTPPPKLSSLVPTASPALDMAFESALSKIADDRPKDIHEWAEATVPLLARMPSPSGNGWPSHLGLVE